MHFYAWKSSWGWAVGGIGISYAFHARSDWDVYLRIGPYTVGYGSGY